MLTSDSQGLLILEKPSIKYKPTEVSTAAQIYPFLHVLSAGMSKRGELHQRVQTSPSCLAEVGGTKNRICFESPPSPKSLI